MGGPATRGARSLPLAFMCVNTLTAGWMNIGVNYLRPQLAAGAPSLWARVPRRAVPRAGMQCVVTLIVMTLLIVVVLDSLRCWLLMIRSPHRAEERAAATSRRDPRRPRPASTAMTGRVTFRRGAGAGPGALGLARRAVHGEPSRRRPAPARGPLGPPTEGASTSTSCFPPFRSACSASGPRTA